MQRLIDYRIFVQQVSKRRDSAVSGTGNEQVRARRILVIHMLSFMVTCEFSGFTLILDFVEISGSCVCGPGVVGVTPAAAMPPSSAPRRVMLLPRG